jgi:uncharacterized protein (TIGR03663 family)
MEPSEERSGAKAAVWLIVAFAAIFAVAVAFRTPKLAERPFHGDEAVQAFKAGQELYEKGVYAYDPEEYHGPTLYYLTVPVLRLCGVKDFADTNEIHYRLVPVIFGLATILCLWGMRDGLGRRATTVAALLTALSPAIVFYNRYYIQESLLVFFTFTTLMAGWRYTRRRNTLWAVMCGASLGMMHSTKETCVITYLGVAAAFLLTPLWAWLHDEEHPLNRLLRRGQSEDLRPRLVRHVLAFLGAGALVSMTFFSSFFTNLQGIVDSVMTYTVYINRAVDTGIHHHEPLYYLKLFAYTHRAAGPWWSEGLILGLAAIGAASALFRHDHDGKPGNVHFLRFVAVYAVVTTIIYSSIQYKTPWSFLSTFQSMILLAGAGAVVLLRFIPNLPAGARAFRYAPKAVVGIVLALLAAHLGWQAYLANFDYYDDPRNPYVYAHPVSGVKRLGARVQGVAEYHPKGREMVVKSITPELNYWPLPWYLRQFPNVGYWLEIPEDCDAPAVITTPRAAREVHARFKDEYISSFYGLRPGVNLILFIRQDIWDAFMADRQ